MTLLGAARRRASSFVMRCRQHVLLLASLAATPVARFTLTPPGQAAYAWGSNGAGEIGDGTATPSRNAPTAVAGGRSFTQVAAGYNHTCGLTSAGTAYCWGSNTEGELGDNTTTKRDVPAAVAGDRVFAQITAGSEYTCGLTSAGNAFCWGSNYIGQLGNNTSGAGAKLLTPTAVAGGLVFTQIVAGDDHTCGITRAGASYCWGRNTEGELGDRTTMDRHVPTAVAGGKAFTQIAAGYDHTCGLTSAGAAYCWGRNTQGEVGDNTTTSRDVPTVVAGARIFTRIAGGSEHTCGLASAGKAYCWGFNYDGQLGDSTRDNIRLVPTSVAGGLAFTQIATGANHTCVLTSAGMAYCWGANTVGQLGDNSNTNRLVPTVVVGGRRYSRLSAGKGHTIGLVSP